VEHFEDNDNNDNDPNDVEDVSVHGSWVTRRCPRRQAIYSSRVVTVFLHASRCLRVILNDQGERIVDLIEKELRGRYFRCLVREPAQPKRSQNQRLGFQIESKKTKRLATSTISIRQALNC
jgi:hypothetical protein